MKRWKALVSLLLCGVLTLTLFAACGKQGDGLGNVVYGRYVEEDLSPEGMKGYPLSFIRLPDGTLDLMVNNYEEPEDGEGIGTTTYLRWRSADEGKTWEAVDMSWTDEYNHDYSEYYERNEQPPEAISLGNMVPLSDGTVLAEIGNSKYDKATGNASYSSELVKVAPDGSKTPYTLKPYEEAKSGGGEVYLGSLRMLPGEKMYVQMTVQPTPEQMNDPTFDWNSGERAMVCDSATGEKLYDLDFRGYQMYSNSTTLYLCDYDEKWTAVNIADGSPSQAPMPSEAHLRRLAGNYSNSTFVDDEGNFYLLNPRGMEKFPAGEGSAPAPSGDEAGNGASVTPTAAGEMAGGENSQASDDGVELMMDGINYTFGSPLYGINGLLYNEEDKSLMLAVIEASMSAGAPSGKLLRYVWDDKAVASSDKKLKVYSLNENYGVRLALSEFKRQNPDVTIEYESVFESESDGYMGGMVSSSTRMGGSEVIEDEESAADESAKTHEDALRALNTELLNGTGPDVLILDGLPSESFIEKGVLEDLSDLVKKNSDLMSPLLEPLYRDGKIYTIPSNFSIPTLFGEKGFVEQFTDMDTLLSAIEAGPEAPGQGDPDPSWTEEQMEAYFSDMYTPREADQLPLLRYDTLDEVFDTFYPVCAPAIFEEKQGIDQAQLTAFLQAVKQVTDKYNLGERRGESGGMTMSYGYQTITTNRTVDNFGQRLGRVGYTLLGSYQVPTQLVSMLHYSRNPNLFNGGGMAVASAAGDDVEGEEGETGEGTEEGADASLPAGEDASSLPADTETSTPSGQEGAEDPASSIIQVEENASGEAAMPEAGAAPAPAPAGENGELPELVPTTVPMPGLASGVYQPSLIMGVTTTTKQPELARAFVNAMLSMDVQKHDMGNGFPVIRPAMEEQNANYLKSDSYYRREGIEMMPVDYDAMVNGVSTPLLTNDYLRNVIFKPVPDFCAGNKSLEETVSQIVSETELYFAERQ